MVKIRPVTNVACDAGPIIHLDELECLHFLSGFNDVIVPKTVCAEVLAHRNIDFNEQSTIKWHVVNEIVMLREPLKAMCRLFALGSGEVSVLSFLDNNQEYLFLTDDAAARLVAEKHGFRVHGTIGVLIRAIRIGLISPEKLVEIIKSIPVKSTLHIKSALLHDIVSQVKFEYKF
jgi:predicted nucleic acid-binding protein